MPQKIARYTAIVIAISGLLTALDQSYSGFRSLQIVHDVINSLEKPDRLRTGPRPRFTLEIAGERVVTDPRNDIIKSAVRTTAADGQGDAFLVLSRSPDAFIQAAREKGGWELEFRATEFDEQSEALPLLFHCQKPVRRQVVITAFQLYGANKNAWTRLCVWTRVAVRPENSQISRSASSVS